MPEITHKLVGGKYVQVVSPRGLKMALDSDGESYARPSHFSPEDEWWLPASCSACSSKFTHEAGTQENSTVWGEGFYARSRHATEELALKAARKYAREARRRASSESDNPYRDAGAVRCLADGTVEWIDDKGNGI